MTKKVVIVGGGAAGIFTAILCKELSQNPIEVLVLEKTKELLTKVRISGGGRCNVTHALFNPPELIKNYPRGSKELLGPFHKFQPQDLIDWMQRHGVSLKQEKDGRMFPVTDSSMTIIHCFLQTAKELGVIIQTQKRVTRVEKTGDQYLVLAGEEEPIVADVVVIATGGGVQGHEIASSLGHTIAPLAPSLFTFNIPNSPLKELSGIAVGSVEVSLPHFSLKNRGPLLITHFGFSGPCVLKLSSIAARELKNCDYKTEVKICWVAGKTKNEILKMLLFLKEEKPFATLRSENPFFLPKNFWIALLAHGKIPFDKPLSHLAQPFLQKTADILCESSYSIDGKTVHKEEFVTCGGVNLKEIDCKSFESKLHPNLFFVGEVLDIDGVTGGFNFQNAWTSSFLAASCIRERT